MRFLDANIFVYAYYKPRRELTQREKLMKNGAKGIISGINKGKVEALTTVQISEALTLSSNKFGRFLLRLKSKGCAISPLPLVPF